MEINFRNKVVEDILQVCLENRLEKKIIITDRVDRIKKKKGCTYIPFIIHKENIYSGYENKIAEYLEKNKYYRSIGINNVEQYICWYLYKTQRAAGYIKEIGSIVADYINNTTWINKTGFLSLDEYIKYNLELNENKKTNSDFAKIYSIKKEYEYFKKEYEEKGVYSLKDCIEFNNRIEKSLKCYEKYHFNSYITKENFLAFELREYLWKKKYMEENNTLKNVQKHILKKYSSETIVPNSISTLPYEYVLNPSYYFKEYQLKNISDFIMFIENIKRITDRYISLKYNGQVNISKRQFIKEELKKIFN